MPKLRVHSLSVSLDGFVAGSDQSLDNPLGVGGESLHEWMFATRYWREMTGQDPGPESPDDPILRRGDESIGAHIMGRNMFGPIRGPWTGDWRGWWGPNPPYHHDVFVLTHHPRESVPMEGGTTFHFITDGPEAALSAAVAVADGKDVRLGGGAATVRAYLEAGLVDELNIAVVPVLLGRGERLFDGPVDYRVAETVSTPAVTHVRLVRNEKTDSLRAWHARLWWSARPRRATFASSSTSTARDRRLRTPACPSSTTWSASSASTAGST